MPFQACSPAETACTGPLLRGNRIINKPAITATKVTPFRKKQVATPTAPISRPATDGPTTRAPFTMELLSEIAFSKSSRLVISTVNARRAGMSKPIAVPLNRSEEHTSELQSRENLVCRLLLEKKKKKEISRFYEDKKNNEIE